MFGSLKLGRFFGIDTNIHGTFWLLPLFVLISGAVAGDVTGAFGQVAFLFALFGCVVLHEIGHALAARYYGVRTRDITLYPIGGVASLERMPEKPHQEIVIALAGPAVNLVIAAGLFMGMIGGAVAFPHSLSGLSAADPLDGFVTQLLTANVFLMLFNLIPAFPMDGGRVLRAALSLGMPRVEATKAAVGVGSVIAVAGGVYGLFTGQLMLTFVAVVIYLLGQGELAAVRLQEGRRRWHDERDEEDRDDDRVRVVGVRPHSSFTGWVFDPRRQVWVEWADGISVREVRR